MPATSLAPGGSVRSKALKYGDYRLVSGLRWRPLPLLDKEAAEAAAQAEEIQAELGVRCATHDLRIITYGFLPDTDAAELEGSGAMLSLAALFSRLPDVSPVSLLVLKDGKQGAMVALRDTLPVAGYDCNGSLEEIIEMGREFISVASQGVTVYGSPEYIEYFGSVVSVNPDELIGNKDAVKHSRIARVKTGSGLHMMALIAVMVLAAGGYTYWDYTKKQEAIRRAAAQQKQDPNKTYAEGLRSLLASAGMPAQSWLPLVKETVGTLQVEQAGWRLSTAKCQPNGCLIAASQAGGTYKSFVAPKGAINAGYNVNGREVVYTVPIDRDTYKSALDGDGIPGFNEFIVHTGSLLQRAAIAGVNFQLSRPEPFGIPPGVMPDQIDKTRLVRIGKWVLSGPYYLSDVLDGLPSSMTLSGFDVTLGRVDATIQFNAEGTYYVK
jgi:hypothetical protein